MEKIKLTANILFSGIGCQERGFQDSELFDIKVLNNSYRRGMIIYEFF